MFEQTDRSNIFNRGPQQMRPNLPIKSRIVFNIPQIHPRVTTNRPTVNQSVALTSMKKGSPDINVDPAVVKRRNKNLSQSLQFDKAAWNTTFQKEKPNFLPFKPQGNLMSRKPQVQMKTDELGITYGQQQLHYPKSITTVGKLMGGSKYGGMPYSPNAANTRMSESREKNQKNLFDVKINKSYISKYIRSGASNSENVTRQEARSVSKQALPPPNDTLTDQKNGMLSYHGDTSLNFKEPSETSQNPAKNLHHLPVVEKVRPYDTMVIKKKIVLPISWKVSTRNPAVSSSLTNKNHIRRNIQACTLEGKMNINKSRYKKIDDYDTLQLSPIASRNNNTQMMKSGQKSVDQATNSKEPWAKERGQANSINAALKLKIQTSEKKANTAMGQYPVQPPVEEKKFEIPRPKFYVPSREPKKPKPEPIKAQLSKKLEKQPSLYQKKKQYTLEELEAMQQKSDQEYQHRLMIERAEKFMMNKSMEREEIEKAIRKERMNRLSIINPSMIEDVDEMLEDNMAHMLNSNEFYDQMQERIEESKTNKTIKMYASKITQELEGKAEQKRKSIIGQIKTIETKKHLHMFFGNKRDQLVFKFISQLKRKVLEKRQKVLEKNNEQLVSKLLKQTSYINQFQNVKLAEVKKEKSPTREISGRPSIVASRPPEIKLQSIPSVLDQLQEENQEREESNSSSSSSSNDSSSSQSSRGQKVTYDVLPSPDGKKKKMNAKQMMDSVFAEYIRVSISMNQQPLPILQKVTADGMFPIVNYQLNESNINSLVVILPRMIPRQVKKIYLVNNAMNEYQLARLIESMFFSQGLKSLGVLQNAVSSQVMDMFSQRIIPSDQFTKIRRLIIKDPQPYKVKPNSVTNLTQSLALKANRLKDLHKLTLSNIGMDNNGLVNLSEAFANLSNLEHLDISSNFLDAYCLKEFIDSIKPHSHLRSLNISYNKASYPSKSRSIEGTPESFEASLATLIHASPYLIHLNISAMWLSGAQCLYLAQKGLRKSRTLLSVHMSGMSIRGNNLIEIRKALKVQEIHSDNTTFDQNIAYRFIVAKQHSLEAKETFETQNYSTLRALNQFVEKQEAGNHLQVKASINKPLLDIENTEKLIFQRILGHYEMYGAHRWEESQEQKCRVCNKMTYCIIIWNKVLSQSLAHDFFYNHCDREPITFTTNDYFHPYLTTKEKIYRMIPIQEFFEKVYHQIKGMSNERPCNNEIEIERTQKIKEEIKNQLDKTTSYSPNYWDSIHKLDKKLSQNTLKYPQYEGPTGLSEMTEHIKYLMGSSVFQLLDLSKYAKLTEQIYGDNMTNIFKDTYICTLFFKDSIVDKNNLLNLAIKHPEIKGVDFIKNLLIPREKHLSVNSMPLIQKKIKKIKEIRHFVKSKSVFSRWTSDTKSSIKRAYETDIAFSKLHKFIKSEDDKIKTMNTLCNNYKEIIDQFNYQMANPKTYPAIEWLDFVQQCNQWKVIDKNLTSTDIDRIFIATNYDEEDLEDNDDNSLCRYEFAEIIVRMAKVKYFDKGHLPTVHESLNELLKRYIIPNSGMKINSQPFRDECLWTLEVDDMIKANLTAIDNLYKRFATQGNSVQKFLGSEDIEKMMHELLAHDPDAFPSSSQQENMKLVYIAMSMSKMTLKDEMKEFDKYSKMVHSEFYEFLGRWAMLLYHDNGLPFIKKLEKLLTHILKLGGGKFRAAREKDDIPSDSDYDDDLVEDIIQEAKK